MDELEEKNEGIITELEVELEDEVREQLDLDTSGKSTKGEVADVFGVSKLDENPMLPYKLQFPYSVKFRLATDECRTEIIINTISEEMTFARSKKDVLFQKERSDAISKEGYIKHIVNWVGNEMGRMDLENCELSYTGTPEIIEMTDEELENYRREVISVA